MITLITVGRDLNFLERTLTSFFLLVVSIAVYSNYVLFSFTCLWAFVLSMFELLTRKSRKYYIVYNVFIVYVILGITAAYEIFMVEKHCLLIPIIICSINDSCAYLFGKMIGGPKLLPSVTPNKTISGLITGVLASTFGTKFFCSQFMPCLDTTMINYVLFFILAIVSVAGGLFSSFIKRKIKIKSYSKILPGHGGIIDRIDGICAACITMYCYIKFI